MAASVKEKNMPTISSNLYGGLQKWVNRASISIRERKKSRRNSDVSQTMYKPNSAEMNGYQDYNQGTIVPVHGRSRSTPVMMPDPENYLNTIEQKNYRKTSEETKTSNLQQEALLEPWGSRESKDDLSRPKRETKDAVGRGTLRRSWSKSESSLTEVTRNFQAPRFPKSNTTPPKCRVRRTSSQDTEESLESCPSDVDINYINKNLRSSQASSRTNIRDRAQTLDSNGNRLNEKLKKSSSKDRIARDVKARLDRWVDKTTGFQDSRQASFESTSSSDDWSDILVLKRENNRPISNETREMRELQNALQELVSSCGRSSRKSSDEEFQSRDSVEAINTRASRKVSLKNTGSVFGRAVDIDYHCPQSVRQNEYRLKKCGSSSGSGGSGVSGGSNMEMNTLEKHHDKTNSELEDSYDSIDGRSAEDVCDSGMAENYETKDSINCDDHVRGSQETRDSMTPENLESEMNNKNSHVPSSESTSQNESEDYCQQSKYYDQQDNSSLTNKTNPAEINEQFSKQQHPVGGIKDEIEDASTKKLSKSTKSYHAPQRPTMKESQDRKGKTSDVTFNDDSLDAFAEECLRQADQKKKKTNKRESKSDSEEEKKALKIDFVYIKRDEKERNLAHSYHGQGVHKKAATHPKTAFDENHLAYLTLSDNELERNEIPSISRIREKRNSADSLDGRVLFDLTPQCDTNSKNEDDRSSDGLQTEEELATEGTGSGMRKFPSMPLFYVPKEFDQSGEFKRIKSESIRKSLWKRIKSLPRQSAENHLRVNHHTKSKKKEDISSAQTQFADPFYHGEKEDQDMLGSTQFRAKAWTLSDAKISRSGSQQRRPSLETRRSAPVLKVNSIEPNKLLNDYVVIPPKNSDESQC